MDYKQKYQLLLGGIVVFALIAYVLAFGKTWTAYQATTSIEKQLSSAEHAWQQIGAYKQQLKQLEKAQGNESFTQNSLFQKVTSFCQEHQLAIQEMPESIVYQEEDMEILYNPIKVEGSFISMIKLLYNIEQEEKLGRVVGAEFKLTKNYQSRKKELTAHIHLQNIQNKTSKPN